MNSPLLCCTPCCTSCKNSFPLPLLSPFFFSSYYLVSSCLFVCLFVSFLLFSVPLLFFFFWLYLSIFPSLPLLFSLLCQQPFSLFPFFVLFSLLIFFFFSFLDLNTSRKTHPVIHLFSQPSLLPALFLSVRFLLGCNIILHSSSSI